MLPSIAVASSTHYRVDRLAPFRRQPCAPTPFQRCRARSGFHHLPNPESWTDTMRRHRWIKPPATSIGKLTYSCTCRIAAGDVERKYRKSHSESCHQKTHGHARPESTSWKARNPVLACSRFMEKTVMTRFNAMRSISALGLLITLCGSADAATVHHVRTYHHHHVTSRFANSFAS